MERVLWVHHLDPILIRIGSLEIGYYGVLFGLAMLQAAYFWCKQVVRSGRPIEDALPYIWMGIAGVIVGGRLGQVLFYKLQQFLSDPSVLFSTWRGGFASHGSTLGFLAALWYYSRRYKMPYLEALDRLSLSIPLAICLVRLGNFMNSEIVGQATEMPWAIVFTRYDALMGLAPTPRHPWQLYEVANGLAVFVLLYLVDRRLGERRPTGLMAGLIFAVYFSIRFCVEFLKESPVLCQAVPLTTGQILSLPFAAIGWVMVATRLEAAYKALKGLKSP
jgi:prolipoprotein diacylglyceryl transferase